MDFVDVCARLFLSSPAGAPGNVSSWPVTHGSVSQSLTVGDGNNEEGLAELLRASGTKKEGLENLLVERGTERGKAWA